MTISRKLFLLFGLFALAASPIKGVGVHGVEVPNSALFVAASVPAAIGYMSYKEPIDKGLNWVCNAWSDTNGKLGIATTAACIYTTASLNNSRYSILSGIPVGLLGAYFTQGLVKKLDNQLEESNLYKFNDASVEKIIFTYINPDKSEFMSLADWFAKKDNLDFKKMSVQAMTKSAGFVDQTTLVRKLNKCSGELQKRVVKLDSTTGLMQKIKQQKKCDGDCTIDLIANLFVYSPDCLVVDDYLQKGFGTLMHGEIGSLFKMHKKSFWEKLVNGSDFNSKVRLEWALLKKYATINFVLNEYICKVSNETQQQNIHFFPTYA